ncbi:MAG: hypothetical protein QOI04_254 [Verrucomicrobiota bacterium]|jgi:hypothetical protein
MSRRILLITFAVAVSFFLLAPRLPAPVVEGETPTPVPKQSATPNAKDATQPAAAETAQKQKKRNPFDGTWMGTINEGKFGDVQFTQVISGLGTVVRSTSRLGAYTWNATCDGKTMQWSVNTKYGSAVRTFTPNPDGKSAVMIHESGAFHASATFYRTSP